MFYFLLQYSWWIFLCVKSTHTHCVPYMLFHWIVVYSGLHQVRSSNMLVLQLLDFFFHSLWCICINVLWNICSESVFGFLCHTRSTACWYEFVFFLYSNSLSEQHVLVSVTRFCLCILTLNGLYVNTFVFVYVCFPYMFCACECSCVSLRNCKCVWREYMCDACGKCTCLNSASMKFNALNRASLLQYVA